MRLRKKVKVNGVELYIEIIGNGFPLLMLYGGPGLDINFFGTFFDELKDEFQLIYVDYRSHGKSEESDNETLTIQQFAKDIKSLTEELELERYAILGHSLGGYVTLQYAVTYNNESIPLILLNTLYDRRNVNPFREECIRRLSEEDQEKIRLANEFIEKAKGLNMKDRLELRKQYEGKASHMPKYYPFASKEQLKYMQGMNYKPHIEDIMNPNYTQFNVTDELTILKHPVCIITSTNDYECDPNQSHIMNKKIPNSELHVIKNAGHTPFIVASKEINKIIRVFLKQFM